MSGTSDIAVTAETGAGIPAELSVADYHRVSRELIAGRGGSPPLRVSILSTHTFEFVRPFLIVEGARLGLDLALQFGPFGQIEQQIADPASPLYRAEPDVLVLAMRSEDVAPDAIGRPFAADGAGPDAALADLVQRIVRSVEAFRARSRAPVLVANFAEPRVLPLGPFDANVPGSVTYALAAANAALRERLASLPDVVVWDFAGLVRAHGTAQWTDPRLWALARVAVAQRHQPALAAHLARCLRALVRPPAKCIALDLDNTLWGGVIGDDGLAGIQLGDDYPGKVFKDFQRELLALTDRGILLAVVSKNDHDVAAEAFEKHPDMVIRWEHLAATSISWEPKSLGIRKIAEELNIGSDQIVFFDDNPVERAEVRVNAPEVLVAEVPTDPIRFSETLAKLPWFDQVALSEEDRKRTVLYRQRRERMVDEQRFGNIGSFLSSLGMTAHVGRVGEPTLARVAQLIGKTNQFNLTTRRHSPAEVAAMAASPDHVVGWLRLSDRFGDQGLVAVGILRKEGASAVIDTLLMSCRVMNRNVEHAFAAYLVEQARTLGCGEVIGEYLPTKKNGMVRDLYPALGFVPVNGSDQRFVLNLQAGTIEWPEVIRRVDGMSAAPESG